MTASQTASIFDFDSPREYRQMHINMGPWDPGSTEWVDQHGKFYVSPAERELAFWAVSRNGGGHSQRVKLLNKAIKSGRVHTLPFIRGPQGQSLLDVFVEAAAWNRVESTCWENLESFWIEYVGVISLLYNVQVPLQLPRERIWKESCAIGGSSFPSPMFWDGSIALAVGMEAHSFKPYLWGAFDFVANVMGNQDERRAFYLDLAICALDWEVHFPQARMLDRYRRCGGSTRTSYAMILEHLPEVIESFVSANSKAAPAQREHAVSLKVATMMALITQWQASETSWSYYLVRLLATKMPKSAAVRVDSFLLGTASVDVDSSRMQESIVDLVSDSKDNNDVTEDIFHVDPPTRINAIEAATFVAQQEAGFVERGLGSGPIPDALLGEEGLVYGRGSIVQVQFKRCPEALRKVLAEGLPLQQCRRALENVGYSWQLHNGNMVFVHPEQYRGVLAAMPASGKFTIAFDTSFEHLVEDSIADIGKGALAKVRDAVHLGDEGSDAATLGSEEVVSYSGIMLGVVRTFVHVALEPSNSSAVVTKTTAAAHCGLNPRHVG